MGFNDWTNQVRVLRAEQMLQEKSWQVTHLSQAVGFGSLRSFERHFRRVTGLSPREYRTYLEGRLPLAGDQRARAAAQT